MISTISLGGLGASASSAAAATPTLTVAPSTALVDRQNVTLGGSNFDASTAVFTLECAPDAVDFTACDLSSVVPTNTDASGSFTLNRAVRRLIAANQVVVDCAAPTGCLMAVVAGGALAVTAAISFDPNVPPVLPTVTVRKSTKLRDHQLVNVAGSGFEPFSSIDLAECVASDPFACSLESDHKTTSTARGTFSFKSFAVERELHTFDQNGPKTVDCAAAPNTCVLTAGGFSGGVPTTVPLQFDASIQPVAASISLDSSLGIKDLQALTVTGSGYLPGATVEVDQCAGTGGACSPFPIAVTAGPGGGFALTYGVRRLLPVLDVNGLRKIDCGSKAGACAMVAQDGSADAPAPTPLGFDRGTAATPSMLTAVPSAHLQDNQRIDVSFTGFSPYQPVTLFECTARALTVGDPSLCDPNAVLTTTTPAGGGQPTASFFARRTIETSTGLVDCGAKAGACILIGVSEAASSGPPVSSSGSSGSIGIAALADRGTSRLPARLSRDALRTAATRAVTGVASAPLSFDPPPSQ